MLIPSWATFECVLGLEDVGCAFADDDAGGAVIAAAVTAVAVVVG
jgi:hypothetical protein